MQEDLEDHKTFQIEHPENDIGDINLDINVQIGEDSQKDVLTQASLSGAGTESTAKNLKNSITIPPSELPDYSKSTSLTNSIENNSTSWVVGQVPYLKGAAHPGMCILTCIFKAASIAIFLISVTILGLIGGSKTISFIAIILAASFDFWVVKNLTGRFLVKLRWWSEIKEDGSEQWNFEGANEGVIPNSVDSTVFWGSLILAGLFWAVIAFFTLLSFSFNSLLISAINLVLISSNFLGYYKCRGAHQKKMKNAISKIGIDIIANRL